MFVFSSKEIATYSIEYRRGWNKVNMIWRLVVVEDEIVGVEKSYLRVSMDYEIVTVISRMHAALIFPTSLSAEERQLREMHEKLKALVCLDFFFKGLIFDLSHRQFSVLG